MRILYEDNHIIVAYKSSGEIVQGDKTGDLPLADMVKQYIKVKYNKPGEAFLGVVHRLDRPVAGLVVFARTSKALARLNEMFRKGEVHKTYWAITIQRPQADEGTIEGWITRNEKLNKSFHHNKEVVGSKHAVLNYYYLASSDRYHLLKVNLLTGRHHQIRCQLASIGCPIKGDLKYGAPRSNPDGSISLLARRIEFVHPVSKVPIDIVAPLPEDRLWREIAKNAK